MRNNVNTNYGARTAALEALEQQGGRELMPALAGQALNDWVPRGIQRATGAGLALGAGSMGGIPAAAGSAAISSPRLMGEAAYLSGADALKECVCHSPEGHFVNNPFQRSPQILRAQAME